MAYERRRLSTESDKSSTSTTHSNESTTAHCSDQKISILTPKKTPVKRNSIMSSPAEVILARTKNTFMDLNPYFECSSLPSHWRKNKSLRFILRTKHAVEIKTNTRVVILAGNDYNPCAPLKNNISWFRGNQAEFNDLRFLGASGRGKKFTLTIIIETTPPQQCTYRRAIKITVDGPRKKRELRSKSDVNDTQADESNIDGDSDNESQITNNSMGVDTKPTMSQALSGSSGLLLLAAAAEKKRNDEKDEPLRYLYHPGPIGLSYSTNCLSPPSLLATQLHSIGFSPTADDFTSHLTRHVFLPNSPTMSKSATENLFLSLKSNPNRLGLYHHHQPQRHDQQTIVATTSNTSTSNTSTNTHVLCR